MKRLNLLIKPASFCNMRCTYCFYRDVSARRTDAGNGVMGVDTLEAIVRQAVSSVYDVVDFAFQGGEPTLAGLAFFEYFIGLLKKYNKSGTRVLCSIQTNGLMIDEKWAAFFRVNKFLVGLSIDGTGDIHDRNRKDTGGKGTYRRCLNALKLLAKNDVEVNVLCVVTNQNASKAQSVYNNLKKEGVSYIQFIPCLSAMDEPGEKPVDLLKPEEYAKFLKTMFDMWYIDWEKGDYISIRTFDDYVHVLAGRQPSSCAAAGVCGRYLTIESDGGVYPCDFYTVDRWYLGDIHKTPLNELFLNEKAAKFIEEGSAAPAKCRRCKYFVLCKGGCKRNRTDAEGASIYCQALTAFFDYSAERLMHMALLERRLMKS